jgi:hypothetical protein
LGSEVEPFPGVLAGACVVDCGGPSTVAAGGGGLPSLSDAGVVVVGGGDGGGAVSVVTGWGGGAVVVSVVVTSAGVAVVLGACALGSWVESVVTSVTGGFCTVDWTGAAVEVESAGAASATVVGVLGTATVALLVRWRLALAASRDLVAPCEEIVTGWEFEWVTTGSYAWTAPRVEAAVTAWW